MNTLPSLASGRFLPQKMHDVLAAANPVAQQGLPNVLQTASASNDDVVSLSDAGVALAKRANELGNATIDMAQSLVSTFAGQLFGDAAKGMKISFDSASVSAMAGYSAMLGHSSGANGTVDAAAFRVQEAADFIGKGQITTADGHVYNFSVEVHYEAMAEAQASSWTANQNAAPHGGETNTESRHFERNQQLPAEVAAEPGVSSQSTQQLNARFPGTIKELFNLLDDGKLNLSFKLPGHGDGANAARYGNLTLRLLDLLKAPAAEAKKLSDAYAAQANTSLPAGAGTPNSLTLAAVETANPGVAVNA